MNCRKTQEQQEQIHIARQPIFDMQRQVYGYELLFRRTLQNTYDGTDPDQATLDVVTNSFLLFGIDSLTRGKLAFINFTANNLLTKLPAMLPREQVAVEILEDVKPDEEVLRRCSELKSAGYMLVLDDFVYKKERLPLVELADIVKIDFRATSAAERQQWQDFLTPYDLRLLAEKVETEEEFQEARAAGYTYVQGYYFSKPALVSGNALPACKANHFKLLQEFSRSDLEFGQIEAVLRKDVSLSYNLLKFITDNSATLIQDNTLATQALAKRVVMDAETMTTKQLIDVAEHSAKLSGLLKRQEAKDEGRRALVSQVVRAVARLTEDGKQATARAVSVAAGKSPTWGTPYLQDAVRDGLLVSREEKVERRRDPAVVYYLNDSTEF